MHKYKDKVAFDSIGKVLSGEQWWASVDADFKILVYLSS